MVIISIISKTASSFKNRVADVCLFCLWNVSIASMLPTSPTRATNIISEKLNNFQPAVGSAPDSGHPEKAVKQETNVLLLAYGCQLDVITVLLHNERCQKTYHNHSIVIINHRLYFVSCPLLWQVEITLYL